MYLLLHPSSSFFAEAGLKVNNDGNRATLPPPLPYEGPAGGFGRTLPSLFPPALLKGRRGRGGRGWWWERTDEKGRQYNAYQGGAEEGLSIQAHATKRKGKRIEGRGYTDVFMNMELTKDNRAYSSSSLSLFLQVSMERAPARNGFPLLSISDAHFLAAPIANICTLGGSQKENPE